MEFVKNKEILAPLIEEPHAFATYKICAKTHDAGLAEEIALGQSLGAWEPSYVSEEELRKKVAKLTHFKTENDFHWATVAFPFALWQGRLHWLLTLAFGKMSFYKNVQLADIQFAQGVKQPLSGPLHSIESLRLKTGCEENTPLLMGILKPNVAMGVETISKLYCEAAEAGVHIVKDDEIRHDTTAREAIKRVEAVAAISAKKNLKTLYAVHVQTEGTLDSSYVKSLENAGASALLLNVWTTGLWALQDLRSKTKLPILAHPALAGAFGFDDTARIHPRVSLAQFVRAGGADLTLFPSPYGKIGLTTEIAKSVAQACVEKSPFAPLIPVPSAGIKPEHGPLAKKDFGQDFVLNAGTAIFAGKESVAKNIQAFREKLYGEQA